MIPLYTLIDLLPYTNARGENYYYALQYFGCDDNRPIPYLDLPFWVFDIGKYNAVTNIITICKNVLFARKSISRFLGVVKTTKLSWTHVLFLGSHANVTEYFCVSVLTIHDQCLMIMTRIFSITRLLIINLSCRIKMVVLQKDLCVIVYIVLC